MLRLTRSHVQATTYNKYIIKALLIKHLNILSHTLKMASSKPKHVAMFSEIVYVIKLF
jgi:hypothetical protein